ncbi:MAG: hypothetical protein L0Z46_07830, partial [Nitrospiraceae bacterium]|nr:hypothetical protein [Nitrospiraceae bacterium]
MRAQDIEAWVLQIVDRVKNGQPIEDVRVELKSTWPDDPKKAARQIAGHANSARGEAILWIIGLDEEKGAVLGAAYNELARWYPAVQAEFDGLSPDLTSLNVPTTNTTVVALLFETERVPYVVKNPVFGTPGGGPVSLEVPWRENNATRTANRSDLVKLLVPVAKLPALEVMEATLRAIHQTSGAYTWRLDVKLYVVPRSDSQVVIPFHRSEVRAEIPYRALPVVFNQISAQPTHTRSRGG